MRRATSVFRYVSAFCPYFNPRSPCGERRRERKGTDRKSTISIHALHAESDLAEFAKNPVLGDFNPRSPCGERQPEPSPEPEPQPISIHALHAESDVFKLYCIEA